MNSRIKDMEAWGNSQGFKSPPSPTQLIAHTKINYNVDDAIEEAGEEDEEEGGKISSPSTKSNSPKDNGDNDSPGGEILADAKVSKTVYDSKRIGDDFCFEN